MVEVQRILGQYTGDAGGPLLVLMGGIHGNEPAGVIAIRQFFMLLEEAILRHSSCTIQGMVLGLAGNRTALQKGVRFLDSDLNRHWPDEEAKGASHSASTGSEAIEREEIIGVLEAAISSYQPTELLLLDLHTTSGGGSVFAIPGPGSSEVATQLCAPVILDLLNNVKHTLLSFVCSGFLGYPSRAVAFEGGLHTDSGAVSNCLTAILHLFHSFVSGQLPILPDRVPPAYTCLHLPKGRLFQVVYSFKIDNADEWMMLPGFQHFTPVSEGQLLAIYRGQEILAPVSGYILMPLYQKQGSDGFFLVRQV